MSDFDTRLRVGLQRLDAAVPTPAAPVVTPPRTKAGPRRRRQVVMLLVATVALLGAASLTATTAILPPPDPAQVAKDAADEERLRNDLGAYTTDVCLTEAEIATLIQERLAALGLSDWTIRADGRYRESPCVGAAPIGDSHEVLLTPSMGGPVATALDVVAADLLRRCLGRDEAVDLLRTTLVGLGIDDPRVEVGGIRGIPLEGGDAYVQHVEDGCIVYGGAQFDNVGRYTWYLSAR